MTVSEHQVAADPDSILADLWFELLTGPRRALCVLAYLDLKVADRDWSMIGVQERMRLIRAMRSMVDVMIDCSMALEGARLAIEEQALDAARRRI